MQHLRNAFSHIFDPRQGALDFWIPDIPRNISEEDGAVHQTEGPGDAGNEQ